MSDAQQDEMVQGVQEWRTGEKEIKDLLIKHFPPSSDEDREKHNTHIKDVTQKIMRILEEYTRRSDTGWLSRITVAQNNRTSCRGGGS